MAGAAPPVLFRFPGLAHGRIDEDSRCPIRSSPIARRDAGSDPYAWLEERDAPEVLDYLKAENAYG